MVRPPKRIASAGQSATPDFAFCIAGRPLSFRAKDKQKLSTWMHEVAMAARSAWPTAAVPLDGNLDVSVVEFSSYRTADRDNMAKPILDAMQGIVYRNDRQVIRLQIEWCDIDGSYIVRFMSPVLAAALSAGNEFLWIRVWQHTPMKDLSR